MASGARRLDRGRRLVVQGGRIQAAARGGGEVAGDRHDSRHSRRSDLRCIIKPN